jgi:lipoprotein-anchoring transpeptidase ErfK/SrfK
MIRMGRAVTLLLVVGLVAVGCGGEESRESAPQTPPARDGRLPTGAAPRVADDEPANVRRCVAGTEVWQSTQGIAAILVRPTTAHRSPGGPAFARFGLVNENGVPTTFRVLRTQLGADCTPAWYRVQLPIRPNGTRGWIRAGAARRYEVDYRIVVDLSDRRVTVFKGDVEIVSTPTAIGRHDTPTPVGSYYVNQRLLASDPSGPFGPGGIGISAFSPVLTGWAQGGPIAIHGTNQPASIGFAASNGCLRIANEVLERLIHEIPDGTPVQIDS